MNSLIKRSQLESIQVDNATSLKRYNFLTDVYDIVEIIVNGVHGKVKNKRSIKTYYIVSGVGRFDIDDKIYQVEPGDIISVVPQSWLSIEGENLKALIITNPPFNVKDEEWM